MLKDTNVARSVLRKPHGPDQAVRLENRVFSMFVVERVWKVVIGYHNRRRQIIGL